jgi:hypothetical protein
MVMEDLLMHHPSTPYTFSTPPPSHPKEPTISPIGLDENPPLTETGAGSNDIEPQPKDISIDHEDIIAQMPIKGTFPLDRHGVAFSTHLQASVVARQLLSFMDLQRQWRTSSSSSTNILRLDSKCRRAGFNAMNASRTRSNSAKTSPHKSELKYM